MLRSKNQARLSPSTVSSAPMRRARDPASTSALGQWGRIHAPVASMPNSTRARSSSTDVAASSRGAQDKSCTRAAWLEMPSPATPVSDGRSTSRRSTSIRAASLTDTPRASNAPQSMRCRSASISPAATARVSALTGSPGRAVTPSRRASTIAQVAWSVAPARESARAWRAFGQPPSAADHSSRSTRTPLALALSPESVSQARRSSTRGSACSTPCDSSAKAAACAPSRRHFAPLARSREKTAAATVSADNDPPTERDTLETSSGAACQRSPAPRW